MKKGTFTPDYILSDDNNTFFVEEKVIDDNTNNRLLDYSKLVRLKNLHERLNTIFYENPDSDILSQIAIYSDYYKKIERNNCLFLDYVNSLEETDTFKIGKDQFLSLLLLDNKKEDAKDIDKNFVLILKCLINKWSYSEKHLKDIYDSIDDLDIYQLKFLKNYEQENICVSTYATRKKINLFVEFLSHYKLNDYQKNKVYESLIDEKNYTLDEMLCVEEPEIVKYLYDDINSRVEDNKSELISRYGEDFYEKNKSLFTNYVLSKNLGRIEEILESKEFKEYPELASATVLAKSNIDQIREILDIPYLKEDWYKPLISSSLFTKKPEMIINNIEICNENGLDNFSNNRTLVIKNRDDELLSKINFLNHFDVPLHDEEKVHPLFSCDSNSDIMEMTHSICGVKVSRDDLKRIFNKNNTREKVLVKSR